MSELAASIRADGLIQSVIVRPQEGTPPYHLVCGHRRFKAVEYLGWTSIEVIVRPMTDEQARRANLQENLARQNLSPSQELRAILKLYGNKPNPKIVAADLGRSKKWVNERLAIRRLHPDVQADVDAGLLTAFDISNLLTLSVDEQPVLAAKLKLAHAHGISATKVINTIGKARRPRTRNQINKLLSDLMDAGIEPPGWKCLAWAAGTIAATELYEGNVKCGKS